MDCGYTLEVEVGGSGVSRLKGCFIFFAVGGVLAGLAIGIYTVYALRRPLPTRPRVMIASPHAGDSFAAGQTQIVRAIASDPEGIERVEFWVNGQQLGVQLNPADGESESISTSQAWKAGAPGIFTLRVRAYDRKGYAGESARIVLRVEGWAADSDPGAMTQVVPGEGETALAVAAALGIEPGALVEAEDGYAAPLGFDEGAGESDDEDGDTPTIFPSTPEPGAPSESVVESRPISIPLWRDSVVFPQLWGRFGGSERGLVCRLVPLLCAVPTEGGSPPLPPSEVHAEVDLASSCEVQVSWRDNAEGEVGYRLVRLALGSEPTESVVAVTGEVPGSGERSALNDHLPPSGRSLEYAYIVVVYNSHGELESSPSNTISSLCSDEELLGTQRLYVEALDMQIASALEIYQVFCYVSLAGSPFERIPEPPSAIVYTEGSWNIAHYFAGSNGRGLIARTDRPLLIEAECSGWRSGSGLEAELVRLGSFARSHANSEWDGRLLTAGPEDGAFQVTYRITPAIPASSLTWPLVDPSLPAPFNLHTEDYWVECYRSCTSWEEPGLHWSWDGGELGESAIRGFEVYQRLDGETSYRKVWDQDLPGFSAPLGRPSGVPPCLERSYFAVSAVSSRVDPATGELRRSPLSGELEVVRTCDDAYTLQIELQGLSATRIRDGFRGRRSTAQAYGEITLNGVQINWNAHCDGRFGHGCLRSGPGTTTLRDGTYYQNFWRQAYLSQAGGLPRPGGEAYSTGNNIVQIQVSPGDELWINFTFYDHDRASHDDVLCASASREPVLVVDPESLFRGEPRSVRFTVSSAVSGLSDVSPSQCGIDGIIRLYPE